MKCVTQGCKYSHPRQDSLPMLPRIAGAINISVGEPITVFSCPYETLTPYWKKVPGIFIGTDDNAHFYYANHKRTKCL